MKKTLSIPRPIVLTGEEMIDEANRILRAEKEKKRGIIRDREGKIIRDKKWKKVRTQFLKIKENVNQIKAKEINFSLSGLEEIINKTIPKGRELGINF